ncbi:putative negative regulator of RcsB-dependent stress response [Luteimonas cucumeris]|uniref:Ancillary SecYEG translocon subunit n=1 Tax=Luteimonas cucumeris TaxID=985012 RepID=A0A562L871_9GAMM|nr:tetratricopeptide repeat protein [Luteimonas cucumeris]TWI03872.1 putative negative regulator of RcsB-dependent stress response [Luteimonas cucumeris]
MAIDDLLDEHEQSERVRSWLQRNALGLIGGVALGLALIGGWQWWQKRNLDQRMSLSANYAASIKAMAGDAAKAKAAIAKLPAGSEYAALAALQLAKVQVEANQRDAAIATLRGINTDNHAIANIVKGRLARLLTDAGKAQEALKLLANADDAGTLEAKGDAYKALAQMDAARDAYSKALARLDAGSPERRLLELKLTDAGGAPSKPGSKT